MLQSQCTELRTRLSAEEERAAAELREAERWQQICNDAQEEMEKLAQAQRLESEGLQKLLGVPGLRSHPSGMVQLLAGNLLHLTLIALV
ncbi:unnamed protein product [Effrenium voratum]|nr:unnamed protein product [Effrenium voratum]